MSPVTACELFIAARLRTVSDLCVILPRTNITAKKLFSLTVYSGVILFTAYFAISFIYFLLVVGL